MAPESDAPVPALGPEFGWEVRAAPAKTFTTALGRTCPQCLTPNWDDGEVCGTCADENGRDEAADLCNDSERSDVD
jgi:hypothetical protein